MSKVTVGPGGKLITYGLDGEMARNYRKFGLYVKDDDPRLRSPRHWFTRATSVFR